MSNETGSVTKRRATIKEVTLTPGMKIRDWTLLYYTVIFKENRQRAKVGAWVVEDSNKVQSIIEASELKRFSYRKELCGGEEASLNHIMNHYKQTAKDRGREFTATPELFKSLIIQDCRYCGAKPKKYYAYKKGIAGVMYNGIDRVDNSKGYVDGNMVPCCTTCNYAKRDNTTEEFTQWINDLVAFQLKKKEEQK